MIENHRRAQYLMRRRFWSFEPDPVTYATRAKIWCVDQLKIVKLARQPFCVCASKSSLRPLFNPTGWEKIETSGERDE